MTWRLGRRPELDGLRGIAILLVLLCHFDNPTTSPYTAAGIIGVTVFFTLSGFLITALLLAERDRAGRIDLPAFYRRRALRLLPALVALLLVLGAVSAFARTGVSLGRASASLFYVANWYGIAHPTITALSHTWSLSVEEQFYLAWPLMLVAAIHWGRRGVLWVAVTGSLLSFRLLVAEMSAGVSGVSERSDTRASSLLVGCALAAWMHGRSERRSRPVLVGVVLAVLVPSSASWGVVSDSLMVVVPLATAVVLYGCAQGDGVRFLRSFGLPWIGQRSYGIYVWHFPVLMAGFALWPGNGHWLVRSALLIAVSFGVALLSWRFVEQPFLAMKDRRRVAEAVPITA